MKKYLIIIGIIAVGIVVFGFIIPPPAGFFGATDDTTIAKLQEKYNVAPKEIKDKYVLENGTLKATPKPDEKDLIEVWIGEKPTEKLGAEITNFEPRLTISRWSEVEFSIKPIAFDSVALKDRTLKFDKEKTIFSTPKIDYSLYEMPISEANPEGAMEYEVILKSKPLTNKIEFTLQDKDVDYFYQPPLTAEEIAKGVVRPENVVGSYAVYAKTPKTNWTGGKLYKTGKMLHLFRPLVTDTTGKSVWADLFIDAKNGIMNYTIPWDFLNSATYPVSIK